MKVSHQEIPVEPFQVRPRFHMWTHLSEVEIHAAFKLYLRESSTTAKGKVRSTYASLQPADNLLHYWSPHLSLTWEEAEHQEGTHIRGLYGPAPAVWTMFIFFYAVIAFAILVVTIIGTSNLSVGNSGAILWALPFLALLFCSLYVVSYTGQRKGHDQVEALHRIVEQCVQPYEQS